MSKTEYKKIWCKEKEGPKCSYYDTNICLANFLEYYPSTVYCSKFKAKGFKFFDTAGWTEYSIFRGGG